MMQVMSESGYITSKLYVNMDRWLQIIEMYVGVGIQQVQNYIL